MKIKIKQPLLYKNIIKDILLERNIKNYYKKKSKKIKNNNLKLIDPFLVI